MKTRFLFIVLLLAVSGIVIFWLKIKKIKNSAVEIPDLQAQSKSSVDKSDLSESWTQSKTMGAVDVQVTPLQLEPGKEAVFELILNTHSVDLGYDYTKIITLTDGSGKTYRAREWMGGNGGHHLAGKLLFESLSDDFKTVVLNINGVDNQTEKFIWDF